ncbi:hypothetical protein [Aestuariivirga sp.]|jgi:hypothetical protein|uniref:hypothetical protein n=1 Tax=Aestuariivirga sp. TaxID=2650926 RepID=UPI00378300CC
MLTKIRLELARDHDHPEGSQAIGYEFAAPLDATGKIDAGEWHKRRDNCRVMRFRPNEADDIGHLIRKPGGSWAFHYDIASDEEDDEAGYRFGDHAFTLGEYVSIREEEGLRTFRVVRVQPV